MSLDYNVIISETEPDFTRDAYIWVKPSVSSAYIRQGTWIELATGNEITSYTAGTFARTIENQVAEPTQEIGKIWIKSSTKNAYIFLDDWYSFAGA